MTLACDPAGRLAAATSTGGLTGKRPGRVGDTPLFGAGTWAENGACAVSTTGQGEFFIRHAVAHDAACRMRYLGESLEAAAGAALAGMGADGGTGGLIAVDGSGRIALPFNTEGMYRGAIGADGVPRVAIYAEALA